MHNEARVHTELSVHTEDEHHMMKKWKANGIERQTSYKCGESEVF